MLTIHRDTGDISLSSEEAKQVWHAVELAYAKDEIKNILNSEGYQISDHDLTVLANKAIDCDEKLDVEYKVHGKLAGQFVAKQKQMEEKYKEQDLNPSPYSYVPPAPQRNPQIVQMAKERHQENFPQPSILYEKYQPGMDPIAFFKNHKSNPDMSR